MSPIGPPPLALQGPLSRTILQQVSPADFAALKYFRLVHTTVRDIPVTISRTGYTGDLGYEVWVDAARAVSLWDALIEAGTPYGITPAGIWALDLARIEAGLVMLDVDYFSSHHALIEDQKSSPLELNLGWTVSADKGPYNGRRALREEKARGSAWGFVGIDVSWTSLERAYAERGLPPQLPTVAWRGSAPLYRGGKQIGYATSGCWSPLLKKYLALAHVRGAAFRAGHRGSVRAARSNIGASRSTPSCGSFRSSIRRGRNHDAERENVRGGVALRRDCRRRWTQRAGVRGLPGPRRPQDARARATAAGRRRRGDRRDLSRIQVFSFLIRRQPAAAGDHSRSRICRATGCRSCRSRAP